jgi:hypothetical protein
VESKLLVKKAPAAWAARPQRELATWSRAYLAALHSFSLRVLDWIRTTAVPALRTYRSRAAMELELLGAAAAERLEEARLNAPRVRADLGRLGARIGVAVVVSVRASRNAVERMRRVAVGYARQRRSEAVLYGGIVALAVAVGWLSAAL